MSMDFRYEARQALVRAKQALSLRDDEHLRYAALELRMAIEGLTYARAELLKDDIPPESYSTWQPRKLMQLLEDIDPNAFKSSTLAFGEQTEPGKPAPFMHTLGTEAVLTFEEVKKHYDALGSFLHLPTIAQAEKDGGADLTKLRVRCDALIAVLETVFASRVRNIDFKLTSKIECHNCSKPIIRRVPIEGGERELACFECGAEYRVSHTSDKKIHWDPINNDYSCPTAGCSSKTLIWRHEIKRGSCWKCDGCGKSYKIDLAIVPDIKQK